MKSFASLVWAFLFLHGFLAGQVTASVWSSLLGGGGLRDTSDASHKSQQRSLQDTAAAAAAAAAQPDLVLGVASAPMDMVQGDEYTWTLSVDATIPSEFECRTQAPTGHRGDVDLFMTFAGVLNTNSNDNTVIDRTVSTAKEDNRNECRSVQTSADEFCSLNVLQSTTTATTTDVVVTVTAFAPVRGATVFCESVPLDNLELGVPSPSFQFFSNGTKSQTFWLNASTLFLQQQQLLQEDNAAYMTCALSGQEGDDPDLYIYGLEQGEASQTTTISTLCQANSFSAREECNVKVWKNTTGIIVKATNYLGRGSVVDKMSGSITILCQQATSTSEVATETLENDWPSRPFSTKDGIHNFKLDIEQRAVVFCQLDALTGGGINATYVSSNSNATSIGGESVFGNVNVTKIVPASRTTTDAVVDTTFLELNLRLDTPPDLLDNVADCYSAKMGNTGNSPPTCFIYGSMSNSSTVYATVDQGVSGTDTLWSLTCIAKPQSPTIDLLSAQYAPPVNLTTPLSPMLKVDVDDGLERPITQDEFFTMVSGTQTYYLDVNQSASVSCKAISESNNTARDKMHALYYLLGDAQLPSLHGAGVGMPGKFRSCMRATGKAQCIFDPGNATSLWLIATSGENADAEFVEVMCTRTVAEEGILLVSGVPSIPFSLQVPGASKLLRMEISPLASLVCREYNPNTNMKLRLGYSNDTVDEPILTNTSDPELFSGPKFDCEALGATDTCIIHVPIDMTDLGDDEGAPVPTLWVTVESPNELVPATNATCTQVGPVFLADGVETEPLSFEDYVTYEMEVTPPATIRCNVAGANFLYAMRFGKLPSFTTFQYDCQSAFGEECIAADQSEIADSLYLTVVPLDEDRAFEDVTVTCESWEPAASNVRPVLELGVQSQPFGLLSDETQTFTLSVPPGVTSIVCSTKADNGDLDIYVQIGSEPSFPWLLVDCKSDDEGSIEECVVPMKGLNTNVAVDVYVVVLAYDPTAAGTCICEDAATATTINRGDGEFFDYRRD